MKGLNIEKSNREQFFALEKDCKQHKAFTLAETMVTNNISPRPLRETNNLTPSPLEGEGRGGGFKKAFTLAETMVTLIVVGIITAATLPVMITNHTQRVNSERHADIVYKMANAMHMMKAQGALYGKFDTTMDFVNQLKRYIKIDKICDSNHIADCWGSKKVITREGISYDVSNAKTRKDILSDTNDGSNPNVGIVLADGTHMILTYDPTFEGLTLGDKTEYNTGALPVGKGLVEFRDYSNNAMDGLAFIFDINGGGGPNKQTVRQVGEGNNKISKDVLDIRGFHGAHFDAKDTPHGCANYSDYTPQFEMPDKTCYFSGGTMNWDSAMAFTCPNGATNESARNNRSALQTLICTTIKGAGGTSLATASYWSNQDVNSNGAYYVSFTTPGVCDGFYGPYKNNYHHVLCSGK